MSELSLRQGLEEVAALGADYLLTDNQGMEWTATGLFASLTRDHSDRLGLPVYLRLPDAHQDGAIYGLFGPRKKFTTFSVTIPGIEGDDKRQAMKGGFSRNHCLLHHLRSRNFQGSSFSVDP